MINLSNGSILRSVAYCTTTRRNKLARTRHAHPTISVLSTRVNQLSKKSRYDWLGKLKSMSPFPKPKNFSPGREKGRGVKEANIGESGE